MPAVPSSSSACSPSLSAFSSLLSDWCSSSPLAWSPEAVPSLSLALCEGRRVCSINTGCLLCTLLSVVYAQGFCTVQADGCVRFWSKLSKAGEPASRLDLLHFATKQAMLTRKCVPHAAEQHTLLSHGGTPVLDAHSGGVLATAHRWGTKGWPCEELKDPGPTRLRAQAVC